MKRKAAARAILRCAAALWERGLVGGSSGNISARLSDGTFLITPSRKALGLLSTEDLACIDARGDALDENVPSSERPLHLAAYAARNDIGFVVHTHPTFCVVWANQGRLFPRNTVAATESLAPIAWVAYHRPGSAELAAATGAALGGAPLALLSRHGLVAIASDIDEAFVQTDLAEECAKVAYYDELLRRAMPPS